MSTLPGDSGDWPTPGGLRTLGQAFHWLVEALQAVDPDTAATEARWILAHHLGRTPGDVLLLSRDPVPAELAPWLAAVVARRQAREPLAYILGEADFFGLSLAVSPAVLIPRPETEQLVEWTIERLSGCPAPLVADVGTGSGAIALALAAHLPDATLYGSDISLAALSLARRNAERHGLARRIHWCIGSLLEPLEALGLLGRLDAVVSNPPYIASHLLPTLQPEVAHYEPREALDGGEDGLALIRPLLEQAPRFLKSAGWLLCEIGHDQGARVLAHARSRMEWCDATVLQDWGGRDRALVARRG